jgi:hypothetical protein
VGIYRWQTDPIGDRNLQDQLQNQVQDFDKLSQKSVGE